MADIQGRTHVSYATLTVGTAVFASNDVLGGTVTFSDLKYIHSRGVIVNASAVTQSGGSLPMTLMFFKDTPTTAANNGAATFAVTDLAANFVGKLDIATTDYALAGSAGTPACVATVSGKAISYMLNGAGNLYCVPIARAAHTFAGTFDLILSVGVLQD